ncbi:YetF domain-containing protein [Clostridium manihotivorum]|uniref:YetF C-terminal domain-containing protein n=1 Tax=Clostridium manihotivorum TaxID=2320868 RepID=A0A410DZW9_9CLOT|nr:DUF421 domain-containing protein [Clostridium manihotivorum]QAA34630.1 hypothetical protein C1I91_25020 [Clostridium manihotivorum]
MLIVLIRTVILYSVVVLVMRLMGKRQIGELQPYEFVITMMISDLAALPMQDTRLPLLLGVIPIITLLMLKTVLSEIQLKSKIARRVIDGTPCVLIKEGKVNFQSLISQRINIDDLMEELRLSGYFNIADIQYAILENNGQVSVIPKKVFSPSTKGDLKIKEDEDKLPVVIIVNGKINQKALLKLKKDDTWLKNMLDNNDVTNMKDVYIAMVDSNGEFFLQKRDDSIDFGDDDL